MMMMMKIMMMVALDKNKYLEEILLFFALGALDLGIFHIAVSRTNWKEWIRGDSHSLMFSSLIYEFSVYTISFGNDTEIHIRLKKILCPVTSCSVVGKIAMYSVYPTRSCVWYWLGWTGCKFLSWTTIPNQRSWCWNHGGKCYWPPTLFPSPPPILDLNKTWVVSGAARGRERQWWVSET